MTPAQEARALLARLGWSHARAAAELGVHRQTVARWYCQARQDDGGPAPQGRSGRVPPEPTLRLLRRLAGVAP